MPVDDKTKRQFDRLYRDEFLEEQDEESKRSGKPRKLKISIEALGLWDLLKSGRCWKTQSKAGRTYEVNHYYRSVDAIALLICRDRKTTRKILKELEASGHIVRQSVRHHGTIIRLVLDPKERSHLFRKQCMQTISKCTSPKAYKGKKDPYETPKQGSYKGKKGPYTPSDQGENFPLFLDPIKKLDLSVILDSEGKGEEIGAEKGEVCRDRELKALYERTNDTEERLLIEAHFRAKENRQAVSDEPNRSRNLISIADALRKTAAR